MSREQEAGTNHTAFRGRAHTLDFVPNTGSAFRAIPSKDQEQLNKGNPAVRYLNCLQEHPRQLGVSKPK